MYPRQYSAHENPSDSQTSYCFGFDLSQAAGVCSESLISVSAVCPKTMCATSWMRVLCGSSATGDTAIFAFANLAIFGAPSIVGINRAGRYQRVDIAGVRRVDCPANNR